MAIERITPDHPLWSDFCAHLTRHAMIERVVTSENAINPGMYALCTVINEQVIGHITLRMQRLAFPPSTDNTAAPHLLDTPHCRPLRELFVQTFAVDEPYRRQGYGHALQSDALELCKRLGCFQLRSWSRADCIANCALKLSMGFAAHPAVEQTDTGEQVSAVYFIKTVNLETKI